MNRAQFNDYLARFFATPNPNPPVDIVPLDKDETGLGPYKLLDKDGKIVGYCGEGYLAMIKQYFKDKTP